MPRLLRALALAAVALAPGARAAAQAPALHLAPGSVARHQMVAVGRDAVVEGEALAGVTAIDGSVRIAGSVAGDVLALGGDVELAAGARVRGDVFVAGGEVRVAAGGRIEGRSVAYPTLSRAWLTLLEGPTVGLSAASPLVIAAKLALAAAWLALALVLLSIGRRGIEAGADEVRLEPLRCFSAGLVGILALVVSALFLSALLPPVVSFPLLGLAVVGALVAKLWGMVAVFRALGGWLGARVFGRELPLLHAATLGLGALAVVKLFPWLGIWCWTAATLVGVGAALRTKFGRREPWFDTAPAPYAAPGAP